MPGEKDIVLSDTDRAKLDDIVSKMSANKEAEADIQFVVNDFKQKYGQKKSPVGSLPSASASGGSSSEAGASVPSGIDYLKGDDDGTWAAPRQQPKALEIPSNVQAPLSAAITPATQNAEQTPGYTKEQINQSMLLGKDFLGGAINGEKVEALGRGMLKGGSILAQSPAFVYDFFTEPLRNVNSVFAPAIPIDKNFGSNGPFEDNQPLLGIAPASTQDVANALDMHPIDDLETALNNNREYQNKKYDKKVSEYLFGENPDLKKGFSLLGDQILESMPISAAIGIGMATNPAATNAVAVSGFSADRKRELDAALPNASEAEKSSIALFSGSLEMAFENLGLTKLGPIIKNLYKSGGKEAAEAGAKEAFKETTRKVMLKYMGIAGEEVSTEMANQFAQNMISIESGEDPNRKPMDGVVDAGLVALGSSGAMVSPTAAYELARTRSAATKATKLSEQKNSLVADLQDPEVPVEAKRVISKKIGEIHEQEAEIVRDEKEKYDKLPEDQKREVDDLLEQSHKLAVAAADENVSNETKEILAKDLSAIDSQVEKIYDENKGEQQPLSANEGDAEEIEYLKNLKETIGLDDAELARLIELESAVPKTQPATDTPKKKEIPQPPATSRPITEMSAAEINDHVADQRTHQKTVEDVIFGDRANDYRQAVREANSTTNDEATMKEASKRVDAFHEAATPEERKALFGEGQVDTKELRNTAQRVSVVEQAETEEDLAKALKNPLLTFAENKNNEGAQTVINAVKRKADELSVDPGKLLNTAVDNITKDLKSPDDAKVLREAVVGQVIETAQDTPVAETTKISEDVKKTKTEETGKETVSEVKPQPSRDSVIDEDEEVDNVKDSPEAKSKLDTDIEAMKQMGTKELAEKKFIGMIERAWKAKNEGKLSKATYADFKNKAKDILKGKVAARDSVDSTEAKLAVTAAMNKVKEKLLGQGYKKITLSSPLPITPKTIDDLLTLTGKLINRGIDAGMTIAEATKKAIAAIKLNPIYKKFVKDGSLDDKVFEDAVNENLKPKKKINRKKKSSEKKPDGVGKDQPDEISGAVKKKKTAARIDDATRMKEIAEEISQEDKFYKSIKVVKATKHILEVMNAYENEGLLVKMAEEMANGEGPFHEKIAQLAAAYVADRLRVLGGQGNAMQKSAMNKLAAKVWANRMQTINVAATITGLEAEVAKMLPLSEEGLRDLVTANIAAVQDTYLSKDQKQTIKSAAASIQEVIASEEGQKAIQEAVDTEVARIAEQTKGKEWVNKIKDRMSKLKIDLSEC